MEKHIYSTKYRYLNKKIKIQDTNANSLFFYIYYFCSYNCYSSILFFKPYSRSWANKKWKK